MAIQFERYYHDPERHLVGKIAGSATARSHRKKFAGYEVFGSLSAFSATNGHREVTHHRSFDERDDEDKAIRFFLMRAPFW